MQNPDLFTLSIESLAKSASGKGASHSQVEHLARIRNAAWGRFSWDFYKRFAGQHAQVAE
jgi:hypothetical protein